MIQDHIEQIQARLQNATGMPEETKAELLNLLAALRSEVGALSQTDEEAASSVARYAAASTHEATRSDQEPERLEEALSGLTASVEGFENSHPELTQVVNRIAVTLSNMGI